MEASYSVLVIKSYPLSKLMPRTRAPIDTRTPYVYVRRACIYEEQASTHPPSMHACGMESSLASSEFKKGAKIGSGGRLRWSSRSASRHSAAETLLMASYIGLSPCGLPTPLLELAVRISMIE